MSKGYPNKDKLPISCEKFVLYCLWNYLQLNENNLAFLLLKPKRFLWDPGSFGPTVEPL